jgi:hypothetical protein
VTFSIIEGENGFPAFAECPFRKDGDECEKSIRLRFSADGYASASFAKAMKMPRAEARGASLSFKVTL